MNRPFALGPQETAMSNCSFLSDDFRTIAESAAKAEGHSMGDPRAAAGRRPGATSPAQSRCMAGARSSSIPTALEFYDSQWGSI